MVVDVFSFLDAEKEVLCRLARYVGILGGTEPWGGCYRIVCSSSMFNRGRDVLFGIVVRYHDITAGLQVADGFIRFFGRNNQ